MSQHILTIHPELTVMMAFAGLVFGLTYFAVMKRTVALFVRSDGWVQPLALTLARIGAVVVFLFLAAKLGAAPLLAAFIGFLIARTLALRAERRAG